MKVFLAATCAALVLKTVRANWSEPPNKKSPVAEDSEGQTTL